ncbi:PREDICTED: scarecrow-like protein 28 isoform X2 [Lupinus angustifolius]|uniref:scarecrow-like protein 28 isoform X2 n=1 Tax=Lupinus angustifolius TaxID=3871 RepID=UPI00092FBB5A|nr:PREDICTED: scarecrow-like protein 28 isoform X2 [Lupinus angustifolius]
MLAGCSSSTLLSPRHRLRNQVTSSAHFQNQACNLHLPSSMNTHRLDLPSSCNFPRKETPRSQQQSLKPMTLSVEKPMEAKTSTCSLKHNTQTMAFVECKGEINDGYWEKGVKGLKRLAEHGSVEDSVACRAKRKKGSSDNSDFGYIHEGDSLSLAQMGAGNFWFQHPQVPLSMTGSEEDERVCFVPSEVVSAPLPLSNNHAWGEMEFGVTKIKNFGEKNVVESSQCMGGKEGSVSNASSESQSLSFRLNENAPSEHEVGNGSGDPYHYEGTEVEAGEEDDREKHREFELVSFLTACVDAIGSRNVAAINHFIAKLGELASPRGTAISRICAYFTEALAIRVTRLWPQIFHINISRELERVVEDETGNVLRLLNQITPIPKFIHFTSNEMLLRSFEGKDKVHIIDFDIKQGLQWPSLFQSLASRTNPPSHVRITGIGESKQELNETGDRLQGFAEALNLPFEFHPVVDRLEDVRLWMLHVKDHESVAVNCALQLHKTLYDGTGTALRDFLGLIRSTNPTVVVMAEQEAEHNDPRLETRVCNALKYYSALFDSIDHCLPQESPMRIKIEEMYARDIRNIIACEGSHRLERHESFRNWTKMMAEQGGFRCIGITEREMFQSKLLLKMYPCENYNVKKQESEEATGVTLSWLEQPLYTVSAWTLICHRFYFLHT